MEAITAFQTSSAEWVIYGNLAAFCKSRGYAVQIPKMEPLEFASQIVKGQMSFYGKTEDGGDLTIVLIAERSSYLTKSDFKQLIRPGKMIAILPTHKPITVDPGVEVEFINGRFLLLRDTPEMMKRRGIEYSIVSEEELQLLRTRWASNPTSMPKIAANAAEVVFSNAKKGDILYIRHPSAGPGGYASRYAVVVGAVDLIHTKSN